jgi:7,8-dihydropterin-6-yl-methyl-4-(beta-D-ribofuranosyl)aminobenzene 5'-phosphate synthase
MWQADRVEITVLVENWIDMLLPDIEHADHCVTRNGLIEHFDPKQTPPAAENGLSLLVRAIRGQHTSTVLFDAGLTGTVLKHNLNALRIDPDTIDHVVISHGHPDHFGGIYQFLDAVGGRVPVASHPDAFLPRYATMGDGRVAHFYNQDFQPGRLEAAGADLVLNRAPLDLGWGMATTGEIPRETSFEGPPTSSEAFSPGLWQIDSDGHNVVDQVWDEQGLVIDVADVGLVVLTGCAHAGVVNTVHQARVVAGDRQVAAVLGGFHLGFPTTPLANVAKTVDAFRELEIGCVVPMHCSGLRAHVAMSTDLDGRYVQPAVGSTFRFGR